MVIIENGVARDATQEEIEALTIECDIREPEVVHDDPLTTMVKAMSTSTTVSQMRAAAKMFLSETDKET